MRQLPFQTQKGSGSKLFYIGTRIVLRIEFGFWENEYVTNLPPPHDAMIIGSSALAPSADCSTSYMLPWYSLRRLVPVTVVLVTVLYDNRRLLSSAITSLIFANANGSRTIHPRHHVGVFPRPIKSSAAVTARSSVTAFSKHPRNSSASALPNTKGGFTTRTLS